jgi:RimJ/RimL family protein N-acetyltransferase
MEPISDGVVRLRPWTVDDAPWYAEVAGNDELIQRFTTESPTLTAAEVRTAILDLLAGPPGAAGCLVADAATGERLGNIALSHENGVGDLSYWLAAPARGRGVATRAVRLLCAWAFATLGLISLRLWTHVDNTASGAVAERVGFRRDPARDAERTVNGLPWRTTAYVLDRNDVLSASSGAG